MDSRDVLGVLTSARGEADYLADTHNSTNVICESKNHDVAYGFYYVICEEQLPFMPSS